MDEALAKFILNLLGQEPEQQMVAGDIKNKLNQEPLFLDVSLDEVTETLKSLVQLRLIEYDYTYWVRKPQLQ